MKVINRNGVFIGTKKDLKKHNKSLLRSNDSYLAFFKLPTKFVTEAI